MTNKQFKLDPWDAEFRMIGSVMVHDDLTVTQKYQLKIMEALKEQFCDYHDMVNLIKALNSTKEILQDNIRYHYPGLTIPGLEKKKRELRFFQLVFEADNSGDLSNHVDEELKLLQEDGNEIIDVEYLKGMTVAIIKYRG